MHVDPQPELTPREAEIAERAARGQTNHEIAAGLGIRPKTVEWTLTRVYRKVGVRSRTELAARAAGGFPWARGQSRMSHRPDAVADADCDHMSPRTTTKGVRP